MFYLSVIRALTALQAGVETLVERSRHDQRGQGMAEYALLILGVGALAVFVFQWLRGSNLLQNLFQSVFGRLLGGG